MKTFVEIGGKIVNNPWLVVCAVGFGYWWIMQPENDDKIPDELEPVPVAEVNAKLTPIQRSLNNSDYDFAVTGISWGLEKLDESDPKYTPEYIHEQLCGNQAKNIEGYYPTYRRVTGTRHVSEGNRCK
tara:strand:- start:964 stop:1347 length:384 start_codon:yes stop_codon:yes gene_type:complete